MSDDVVKRLLIKLGIDGADAVQFISRLQAQLDSMYEKSRTQSTERKRAQQDDLAAMARQMDLAKQQTTISEQQVATLRKQIEAKQITVKQIQEEITSERLALDIRQNTLRVMSQQGQLSAEVAKGLEKQISLERQKLALQQAQLRATGMTAAASKEQSERGAVGGVLAAGARGLFGGGLLGGVAGGIIGGMAAVEGIQLLMEGVRELGKALMEASGPAQTLRLEFEKLATRKGNDPAELLQKMRVATHGMAADAALFQTANVSLRSNMKLTTDQMVKMLGMTVDLARLNGKDVPQALNAFTRAMETGQPFILARTLGLTNLQRGMQQLPRGIDPAVAATVRMNQMFIAMSDAINKGIKPVAVTLPELFTQIGVAEKNFLDGVAEGVFHTGSFATNIQAMSKALTDAMPKIVEVGKAVGEGLSAAVKWLIDHGPELKIWVEALVAVKIADWALTGAGAIWKLVGALGALNAAKLAGALGGALPGFAAAGAGAAEAGGVAATVAAVLPVVTAVIAALGLGYLLYTNYSQGVERQRNEALMGNLMRYGSPAGPPAAAVDRRHGGIGGPRYGSAAQAEFSGVSARAAGNFAQAGSIIDLLSPSGAGGTEAGGNKYVDIAALKQAEVLRETIRREGAKIELQIAKDENDAEQEMLRTRYEMGLLQLDDYLAQQKVLRQKATADRDREIEIEGETQKAAARVKIQPTRTPEGIEIPVSSQAIQVEKEQEELIDRQTQLKILENHESTRKQDVADEMKSLEDKKSAQQAYQQELIKMQRESLAEQTALVEKQFKQGDLGPEQYISQRRAMIEQEAALVQGELQQELDDTTKTEKQKADIRIKGIEAALAAQKQLTDLTVQQDQIRVQAMENSYARIKSGLQAQQAAAQLNIQQRVPGARAGGVAILEQMSAANQKYIEQLTQEASTLANQPQLWAQTVDKIKQATEEQIKLNQQLRQSKDFAAPLAGLFGDLAGAVDKIRGGGAIAAILKDVQTSMESLSKYTEGGGPSGGLIGSLFHKKKATTTASGKITASGPAKAADDYNAAVEAATKKVKSLSDQEATARASASKSLIGDLAELGRAFQAAAQRFIGPSRAPAQPDFGIGSVSDHPTAPTLEIPPPPQQSTSQAAAVPAAPPVIPANVSSGSGGSQGMGGFIGAIQNSTSKLQTFAGGIGGAASSVGGFISTIQNAKSTAGGAISGGISGASTGMQIGGPWGALIGGIAGAAMGAFVGHKQAQVTQDVRMIQGQLENIIEQLKDGTISIATAIANLRAERQAAIKMLSGTKGGKGKKGQASQLQTILSQIDAQIQQLLDEQKQLLDQMDQSILTMSQGIYWQPILTQLDQIVKQYQQFASAAQGNTQQVAAANQYLTESLQNYSQTMQQTFLSDQEQAIQNAQTLLQLEQQQAEMTNQYQSQVYGILSQGVTSRQLSGAQTKGAELQALNQQYSQQQLQMKQEIAVAAYKYQIQQKIFNLASTQVGLEMEMVAVQDAQANNSLQSVMALQEAMTAINAALASGTLPSLLTGATSTGFQGLLGILQLLGLAPPNVPGTGPGGTNYITEIPSQWQGIVQYMNTIDPNFMLDVLQAMMTGPGSNQRKALVSLINNPEFGLATDVKGGVYGAELGDFLNWLMTGASLPPGSPLPPSQPGGYQSGTTYVPQTGMALIHEGEAIIPADQNPWSGVGGFDMQSVNATTSGALSDANLQVEQQIYQLVMARVSAEWQLIQAKMQLLQQEQSGGVASFEGGMQKVYETRGRYGSGSVRTEYL